MNFGNTSGCFGVPNWEEAEKHFARTPRPKERKARPVWDDYTRPLYDARKWHYRLERDTDEKFYDVWLYHTCMARYHKPEGDTRVVEYNFDGRSLSSQFMWQVTGSGRRMMFETTDGRQMHVPVCRGGQCAIFGTTLTLVDGKVDLSRSKHRDIGTYVMSDEKKAWLKELRAHLAPFFVLMECRIDSVRSEWVAPTQRSRWGYPGAYFVRGGMPSQILEEEALRALSSQATQMLSDLYVCKVAHSLDGANYREKEPPTHTQLAAHARAACIRDLTYLYRGKAVKFKPLPQFPEDLPRAFSEA